MKEDLADMMCATCKGSCMCTGVKYFFWDFKFGGLFLKFPGDSAGGLAAATVLSLGVCTSLQFAEMEAYHDFAGVRPP